MLDGLVRGSVLAHVERIVGKDEERSHLHQRGQAKRRAHVIAEDQERAAIGKKRAIERDAIGDGPHGVLAHTEVDVAPRKGIRALFGPRPDDPVLAQNRWRRRAGEIRRAPHHVGHRRVQTGKNRGRVLAGGVVHVREALGESFTEIRRHFPIARRVPGLGTFRIRFSPGLMARLDRAPIRLLLGDTAIEIIAHVIGNMEGRLLGPPHGLLGAGRLLRSQGRAVGLVLACHARAPASDHCPQNDQAGTIDDAARRFQTLAQLRHRLPVDGPLHMPALGLEARGDVFTEGEFGPPVDGDPVVIVNEDQVAETQVARQGGRFTGDPLHHVAIAHHPIDEMFAGARTAGTPEMAPGHARRKRHPHRVGETLAQGAGGGLDPGRHAVFGMAGRQCPPLTKGPDLIQGKFVPVEVQHAVEKHRCVPPGEHEAVAQGPVGVRRIEAKMIVEEFESGRGQAHGGTGMSALGRIHGVNREEANGILDFFP